MATQNQSAPIFFDLDGTLTDPKAGIVGSIQYAIEHIGHEAPVDDELTWCIGPPLQASLQRLVGKELAPQALLAYRQRYSEIGWQENRLYPGIAGMLQRLQELDRLMYVATSKPLVFADQIIRHFELDSYFTVVFGSELDGTRSDKAELLRYALSEVTAASQPVMVGDREYDVIGAKANQMKSVGVSYGYGSRHELQSAGAGLIVDDTEMLFSVLV